MQRISGPHGKNFKQTNTQEKQKIMKLKTLVFACLIGLSSIVSANPNNPAEKERELTNIYMDVKDFLKNPNFALENDVEATVKITVNNNNEIVVLSVNSNNEVLDTFIKARLNYKKLTQKVASNVYTLPLKVLASK
ncbi:MAG: hypothetical protein CMB99_11585 [Flavobacteriaceae bacterium]|nr:hypothetical protein [Flavobacteriaceae bacterium]